MNIEKLEKVANKMAQQMEKKPKYYVMGTTGTMSKDMAEALAAKLNSAAGGEYFSAHLDKKTIFRDEFE